MGVSCGGPSWGTPWGQGARGSRLGAPHWLASLRPPVPLSPPLPLPRFKLFSFARTLQGPGVHGFPASEVMCGSKVPWERASASSFPPSLVTDASGRRPPAPRLGGRGDQTSPCSVFSWGRATARRPRCSSSVSSSVVCRCHGPAPCLCPCLGGSWGSRAGVLCRPFPCPAAQTAAGAREGPTTCSGGLAASCRVRALLLCGGLGVSCPQVPHFSPARTPAAPWGRSWWSVAGGGTGDSLRPSPGPGLPPRERQFPNCLWCLCPAFLGRLGAGWGVGRDSRLSLRAPCPASSLHEARPGQARL